VHVVGAPVPGAVGADDLDAVLLVQRRGDDLEVVVARLLNPTSLRYVRREDGQEIEVSLDEVRRLGEVDADFRRSIVSSKESMDTIVDASIRELDRLRPTALAGGWASCCWRALRRTSRRRRASSRR
jgi:hypothetical protein